VARVAEGNLAELSEDRALFSADQVARLSIRTREALQRNAALLEQRAQAGEVRRCHGDLHLGNIALIGERPVISDALEFDEELATTDVLYDLAFLLMDCLNRDARPAANRILNRWLSRRRKLADLDGLALLPLFLSMRAAVRAKVLAARAGAENEAREAARAYLDAAVDMLAPAPPVLLAIGGFSGSGKSTAAQCVAHRLPPDPGAVILRSDQIRKEIAGVGEFDRLPAGAYTQAASDRVYAEIRERAGGALRAGHSVIADAVHGTQNERDAIAAVAARAGCPFGAVWLEGSRDTLLSRVGARVDDASDATGQVVDLQLESLAAPADWPRISSSGTVEDVAQQILGALRARFPGFNGAVR
jgi:predicted kinase